MRRGELLALSWDDVDLEQRTLRVAWSLAVIDRQIERKPPKNARTRRLSFDRRVAEALERQQRLQQAAQARHGVLWNNPCNLVFTQEHGSPHHPDAVSGTFRREI